MAGKFRVSVMFIYTFKRNILKLQKTAHSLNYHVIFNNNNSLDKRVANNYAPYAVKQAYNEDPQGQSKLDKLRNEQAKRIKVTILSM